MLASLSDAKDQLTELVRRAEAGDEIVLTRHGHPTVKLVPVKAFSSRETRAALLQAVRGAGRAKATAGADAAHSQDFCTEMMVCPDDGGRYARVDGDHS